MKKVYFVGGAEGVGKTSLINGLLTKYNIKVMNTGSFFSEINKIEGNWESRKKKIKKRIIDYILEYKPLIVDTHYAGFKYNRYDDNFERGLSKEELLMLAKNLELEFILVTLDPEELLIRRKKDNSSERNINLLHITKELYYNSIYFILYCEELKKTGYMIINEDFYISVKKLEKIIKNKK